jgi:uncharacterized protein YbjT (DUF2867 family)
MGRGGEGDFEDREREAARNFAETANREGVERVVYLGGLPGDQPRSQHLRSRAQTADILGEHGPAHPFPRGELSSLWIGLVTPVDAGVARPLIEGLSMMQA